MFSALVASFVVACSVITITLAVWAIRADRRTRAHIDRQIQEDIDAGVFPEWIYGPRMDVPGKYPAVRTRSTRVLTGK